MHQTSGLVALAIRAAMTGVGCEAGMHEQQTFEHHRKMFYHKEMKKEHLCLREKGDREVGSSLVNLLDKGGRKVRDLKLLRVRRKIHPG